MREQNSYEAIDIITMFTARGAMYTIQGAVNTTTQENSLSSEHRHNHTTSSTGCTEKLQKYLSVACNKQQSKFYAEQSPKWST